MLPRGPLLGIKLVGDRHPDYPEFAYVKGTTRIKQAEKRVHFPFYITARTTAFTYDHDVVDIKNCKDDEEVLYFTHVPRTTKWLERHLRLRISL